MAVGLRNCKQVDFLIAHFSKIVTGIKPSLTHLKTKALDTWRTSATCFFKLSWCRIKSRVQ
jgi:hypothetical protein